MVIFHVHLLQDFSDTLPTLIHKIGLIFIQNISLILIG